jgi:predicted secreted hydrolase
MRRFIVPAALLILIAGLGGGVWAVTRPPAPAQVRASISAVEAVGGVDADARFARATAVRPFVFPADHGPHEGFRTEWWYYTGNLVAADGRRFGYQLTFFRTALSDRPAERQSEWAATNMYMAHFALTDVQSNRFYAFDRFSRDAAGLAGASGEPYRVFLEDWSASGAGAAALPMRLQARAGDVAIDLSLDSTKPPTLQGDRGLSQKGAAVGNASYYYSLTRMPTSGSVSAGGATAEVTGDSWMDREWSTSSLEEGIAGWDWFALQLDDGRDITVYLLRLEDGTLGAYSDGTLTYADGTTRQLDQSDFQIEVLDRWTTPRADATVYPAKWRVRIPSEQIDLTVTPQVADQELQLAVRYWEGSVRIEGSQAGYGYVELTGYGDGDGARAK